MDDSKEFVYAVKIWDKNYHKMKKLYKEIQNLKDKKLKYELEKREAEKKIVDYLKKKNEWKIGTENGVITRNINDKLTYNISKK